MSFYPTRNLLDFALFAYEYIEFMYPVDNCILSIQDKKLWLLSFEFLSGQNSTKIMVHAMANTVCKKLFRVSIQFTHEA